MPAVTGPASSIKVGQSSCPVSCAPSCFQIENLVTAIGSDRSFPTAVAENCIVTDAIELCEVVVCGVFGWVQTPPAADYFTLIIHADDAGKPGPVIYSESGIASTRAATGELVLGQFVIYRHGLTPSVSMTLSPGTYWFQVFNDTADDPDDFWFWATAFQNPTEGIPGSAFASQSPGSIWSHKDYDYAMQLCGKAPDRCIPFCTAVPNATGSPALLTCTGDPSSSLVLTSSPVPDTPGQFFFGTAMLSGGVPLGDGVRCVGGSFTRLLPFVGAGIMMQAPNTASITLNYSAPYASGLTGTKHFQHWFRSGVSVGHGSNTSNAVSIIF